MSAGALARKVLGRHFHSVARYYRAAFVDLNAMASALCDALPRGSTVLDVGGGDGAPLNHLLAKRPDLNVSMMDIAPSIGEAIEPCHASHVTRFPKTALGDYAGPPPDAILIIDVLHHIPEESRPSFFNDLATTVRTHRVKTVVVKDVQPGHLRSVLGWLVDRYISGDRKVRLIRAETIMRHLQDALGTEFNLIETPLRRLDAPKLLHRSVPRGIVVSIPHPVVTIAIPFAGGRIDFFQNAWRSLRDQSFPAWKAVVVDDTPGGSQQMEALVRGWSDPKLTYRLNEGEHGIGSAWNACIEAVDTELFSLLHYDDELEPDYLSTMLGIAELNPTASLYFCGATIIDSERKPCFSLPDRVKGFIEPKDEPVVLSGAGGIKSLIVGNYIMCPTVMYRRSAVGRRRFSTSHRFVLDFRFTLGVLLDGGTIVGTHHKAYRYRRHEAQATSQLSRSGDRFQEELDLFREMESVAASRGWKCVEKPARARAIFRINAALSGKWPFILS